MHSCINNILNFIFNFIHTGWVKKTLLKERLRAFLRSIFFTHPPVLLFVEYIFQAEADLSYLGGESTIVNPSKVTFRFRGLKTRYYLLTHHIIFLDAIASLELGYESNYVRDSKPFSVHNHCKMLSFPLDVWSCFC